MVSLTEVTCPNCGAPLTVTTSQCAYCKIHLVASTEDAGPEPPPVVMQGRSERLAKHLDGKKMQRLWRYAGSAWGKRAAGVTMSDEETFAREVLMATVGTALVAARGDSRDALAETLATVSGGLIAPEDVHEVLGECLGYLQHHGREKCLEMAAELLEEAGLLNKGYGLAVGIVLLGGTITRDQGEALDAIAAAYGLTETKARKARKTISELMA